MLKLQILDQLSQRGYSVTLNIAAAGERRVPPRKEDRKRGTDARWAASIRSKNASATDVQTGFGESSFDALIEAMDRGGVKITGINL